MSRRGWLFFAAMSVLWGIPYLLISVAVRDVSPAVLVFARTGIASLLLVPIAAARGQLRPLVPHWRPLLAYSAIEVAVPWLLLSIAEQHISSSLAALIVAAVPLVAAGLARLTGDADQPAARQVAGLVVGLAGVATLLGFDLGGAPAAAAAVCVVAVCYAIGPRILATRLSQLPGLGVVAVSLGLTALAYLPATIVQWPAHTPPAKGLLAMVLLGLFCTALAFLVFFALIAEAGPVRAMLFTYVNPVVALVLGVLLLDEQVTLATAAGFVLILAGCWIATRPRPARDQSDVPPELLTPAAGARSEVG